MLLGLMHVFAATLLASIPLLSIFLTREKPSLPSSFIARQTETTNLQSSLLK
jgi:hypothetical protein